MRSSRPFEITAALAGAAVILGLIHPSFAFEADYSGQIRVVGGVDFPAKASHLDVEVARIRFGK